MQWPSLGEVTVTNSHDFSVVIGVRVLVSLESSLSALPLTVRLPRLYDGYSYAEVIPFREETHKSEENPHQQVVQFHFFCEFSPRLKLSSSFERPDTAPTVFRLNSSKFDSL